MYVYRASGSIFFALSVERVKKKKKKQPSNNKHTQHPDFGVWYYSPGASQMILVIKNPSANLGDKDEPVWSGRSPGQGHGNSLQYCCLKNPVVTKSWT